MCHSQDLGDPLIYVRWLSFFGLDLEQTRPAWDYLVKVLEQGSGSATPEPA